MIQRVPQSAFHCGDPRFAILLDLLPDGTAELRKFVLDVAFIDVSEIDRKLVHRTGVFLGE